MFCSSVLLAFCPCGACVFVSSSFLVLDSVRSGCRSGVDCVCASPFSASVEDLPRVAGIVLTAIGSDAVINAVSCAVCASWGSFVVASSATGDPVGAEATGSAGSVCKGAPLVASVSGPSVFSIRLGAVICAVSPALFAPKFGSMEAGAPSGKALSASSVSEFSGFVLMVAS